LRSLLSFTDEDLLLANTPDAFGEFYDRHARALAGFFARRTGDPEVAADLTAETFASAIVAQRRFKAGGAPATAWLFVIAMRRLADYQRRGRVDQRVRRSLEIERRPVSAEDADLIRLLADVTVSELLGDLPIEQRDAVAAHVVDGQGYADLAAAGRTSEEVVRQRVSRGLATLRRRGKPAHE
jgi:RNA polymerase sigma factor (sigma-70 family)